MKRIAITTGDPAGIGAEITGKALHFWKLREDCIYIVYGSINERLVSARLQKIKSVEEAVSTNKIYLIEIHEPVKTGSISQTAGEVALQILERCTDDIKSGKIDAVVTCPVCKESIQMVKPDFIGHTEFFAEKLHSKHVTMSFWGNHFHLALMTTHHSIQQASAFLTFEFMDAKLRAIIQQFSHFYEDCRFAVLGINPHAGEGGAFGTEDEVLKAIIRELQSEDIQIEGPFPADTFFRYQAQDFHVVISAFHDQGLIPFKMLSSEQGVNVTLGLPILRTSVDHGTAFDIAGKGIADETSLAAALEFAENGCYLRKSNCIYGRFAPYYDHYMKHVNYDLWVKFILSKYRRFTKEQPHKILELACGTGNIVNRLDNGERTIYAMDNSPEMLKIAEKKNPNIHYFIGDFTEPLPYKDFDFIVLLFDSINYLHEPKEIMQLLHSVQNALKKDGIFLFDISTILNCEQNFDGFVNLEEDLHSYMIHQSSYQNRLHILKTTLTFFIRKGFIYERFDEVHSQKIYTCSEIVELLLKSPLKLLGVFTNDSPKNLVTKFDDDLDTKYQRVYFVLQK